MRISEVYTFLRDATPHYESDFQFLDSLAYLRENTCRKCSCVHRSAGTQHKGKTLTKVPLRCWTSLVHPPMLDSSSNDTNFSTSAGVVQGLQRQVRTKRALKNSRQVTAIQNGREPIESMAETAHQCTKISEELLKVDQKMAMITLLSMLVSITP